MPGNNPTLGELKTDLRERLDESTELFWREPWLTRILNEGAREVARRTECLEARTTLVSVANQSEYPNVLPLDLIRVYRAEFARSSADVWPLEYRSPHSMDAYWTGYRTASGRPEVFTIWGPTSSAQVLIIFPADNVGGLNLTLWYYRLPAVMASDTDTLDLPRGWHELPILYAEYVAKRKDRDPTWQEAKAGFEEKVDQMLVLTGTHSDQSAETFGEQRFNMGLPPWLVGWDEAY